MTHSDPVTTTRRHRMPFGAELTADGRVRFRLWAPVAERVDLCLGADRHNGGEVILAMSAEAQGWFSLVTAAAGAGTRYCFQIDGGQRVPDPASRCQVRDVHGPSEVIDPGARRWRDAEWRGRPWQEAVIYELHVGSFTPAGTFAGVRNKLDYLADLGVTAIELMPVADFPGARNWGYDGVLPFAPDRRYGRPEDLKALVDAAHRRGLMVLLDVVYNHFGPEGNYLHHYAPAFFSRRHRTPWGAAINFDGDGSRWVREFFIHNALYWLQEFHFDGLRIDAVHAIADDSPIHILTELARRVNDTLGAERHIHLLLENDRNEAHYLERDSEGRPRGYTAQWNDDFHHALHVLLTGEREGYYLDYSDKPVRHLGRCLCEGFAYQGGISPYRGGARRGEPSGQLPPTAFVSFLQNHDQIGNRSCGERISALAGFEAVRAATVLLLLAPSPPLLFMGQEWGCEQPFLFFCDLGGDLADKVREGRRAEFARFPEFADPARRARIPDPGADSSFCRSLLDWTVCELPYYRRWLDLHRELLALRRREVVPRLSGAVAGSYAVIGCGALAARWPLAEGATLHLLTNLVDEVTLIADADIPQGRLLYGTHPDTRVAPGLPPWSVFWSLDIPDAAP